MRRKSEVIGLLGFTVSGFFFIASAIQNGDTLALAGSGLWVLSCLVWIGALMGGD